LFAVLDNNRAYALFWQKAESRYTLAELMRGTKLSIGDMLDLSPGPEKFIGIRYEKGGDLYSEKGLNFFRWDQPRGTFSQVGTIPLEVNDNGEEQGISISRRRTITGFKNIDNDPDREVIVEDAVQVGANGTAKSHVD